MDVEGHLEVEHIQGVLHCAFHEEGAGRQLLVEVLWAYCARDVRRGLLDGSQSGDWHLLGLVHDPETVYVHLEMEVVDLVLRTVPHHKVQEHLVILTVEVS